MFGRSKAADNPLWEIRRSLLSDPRPEAASLVAPGTTVWGVLVEIGYPQGPVTLLVVGDGTTSLYLPTGGGVIGAGEHPAVRAAATALMLTVHALRAPFSCATDIEFPAQGRVRVFALTLEGVLVAEGEEQSVGNGVGPLSAVFHAGQAVLSQVRIASQNPGSTT
jgi:hypothetical protein